MKKVFIAYHLGKDDEYKNQFLEKFQEKINITNESYYPEEVNDRLFSDQDLINKIKQEVLQATNVTIVLIGSETWKRKNVDWEIAASLQKPKSLILGIFLPTNNNYGFTKKLIDEKTIPARLFENYKKGYLQLYNWNPISMKPFEWISAAEEQATQTAHNNLALLRQNR
ncbi:TIR domain-containing protein [Spiroplasma eriocheiris]|uniref:Thoeris protein ThsB TIR-like domain-containing protein n=1 Tax=Spiroplasma eriocheiris TaxID=315358 RepID=A0A0H3XKP9_9MOLU|nr:TIR domain-containing protein [Spiroplasma eriocheiris]AHF58072.1 hypothetical protein SPE_0952 [Spiroplasma eriocheiris CCTCC M 207170]AKM54511.1 hypothetical protein SERIO_v1c09530 [Spiroplasma eriocheiris]